MRKKDTKLREKIIKSALKIFSKRGYFKTTVEDIARSCGVAKGTVYLYFSDKESIYIATIEKHLQYAHDMLYSIAVEKAPAVERLMRMAKNIIEYMTGLQTSYPMFTFENIHLSSKMLKKIRHIVMPMIAGMNKLVGSVVKEGIESGEFREVNAEAAAFCFLSAIRTTVFGQHILSNKNYNINDVLELYFEGLRQRR